MADEALSNKVDGSGVVVGLDVHGSAELQHATQ